MAGKHQATEYEHLRSLARSLDHLLAEIGRVNRRLRNARAAVHAVEDELTRLCEEVTARADALDRAP